VHSGSRWLHVA